MLGWRLSVGGPGPSSHLGGTRVAADVCVDSDVVTEDTPAPLADAAIEQLARRAAGVPRRTAIEVGDPGSGWRDQRGRPWSGDGFAVRRALGGMEYPASRDRVVETCKEHLRRLPLALAWLERLPAGDYGGPDEAWMTLEATRP